MGLLGDMCSSDWAKCKCLIDRLAGASRDPALIDQLKAKGRIKLTTQTLTSAALTLA